ncbi:VOC family protein [Pedobacter sp. SYSU D00535]|uniref:VOC family protein n=1 Tax=Pedobacter sp. SYSU D00535 TaxID=2810308 RepID=UPI001A965E3D|nr:VOC family protein [Pedobacter sp. SYSU D00535]
MKHLVNWVEIPVIDFERAVKFYAAILSAEINVFEMGGMQYGLFPTEDQKNTGALVKGEYYQPSENGIVIYLDGGEDLNLILEKVKAAGGTVLMEKTFLSEEAGYVGMFADTEGNRLGLQHN